MWKTIVEHCKSHLVVSASRQGLILPEGCQSRPTEVDDVIQGTSQNSSSPSLYKCLTIRELLECDTVRHSHTENARCLPYHDKCGLKPIPNGRSFLIALLSEGPTLPGTCGDAKQTHAAISEEEGLYLKDDTGVVLCRLSTCDQKWLDQVLLVPCWNYIPGADARVQSIVEMCPQCAPVVVSRSALDTCKMSDAQAIPILTAVRLLANHDSSKNTVNLVTIRGIVVSKSPIIRIHGKAVFFFRMAMDVSRVITVPLLVKGKVLPFLHGCLPVNFKCTVTHLRPTTISKGTRHPYHIFLCTKESGVVNVERACSDEEHKNRHSGTITKCIDASSGIYELDGKYRLYLSHQMDDSAMYIDLRVGSVVTIYNAHYHRMVKPVAMPAIACCMQSTVTISAFSPLDTGPRQKSNPPLSGSVRLLLKHKLTLYQLEWLLAVMSQLEIKFSPTLLRKKALHTVLYRLFNTPSTVIEKPLISGRKRNIYEEFLNASHCCLASLEDGIDQLPPWQFPLASSLRIPTMFQDGEEGSSCLKGIAGGISIIDDNDNLRYSLIRSFDQNPPMILIGYLHVSPTTGQVHLRDQTASVDCIITDVLLDSKSVSCTSLPAHVSQDSTPTNPAECSPRSTNTSKKAECSERKCALTSCQHLHTWCQGHLIRVDGFLIVQEALPLRLVQEALPLRLTRPNSKHFVAFSMKFATCLNCTASSSLSNVNNCLLSEAVEGRTLKSSRCNQKGIQAYQPGLSAETCNKAEMTTISPKVGHFLLLMKSQLLANSKGSLFFVIQVVTLARPGCTMGILDSKKDEATHTGRVAVRFDGDSVRWYHTLYPCCVYKIKGEMNRISQQDFLQETFSVFDHLNLDEDSLPVMRIMPDATLEQIHESSLPGDIADKLHMVLSHYKDILHVSSVQDMKTKGSDGLVSFHCVIISRNWSSKNESDNHHDKKTKMSPGGILDEEVQLSVADLADRAVTVNVVLNASVCHNVMGLLPGATVTFRQCVRSTSPDGYMFCRLVPLTSITVDSLTSDVTCIQTGLPFNKDFKKHAPRTVKPTDSLTTHQTEIQVASPILAETAQPAEELSEELSVEPIGQESPRRLQQFRLCDLTDLPLPESLSMVFIVKCFLQSVKSLVLKWSCQRCGHKDCACSERGEQDGEVTATARFMVDDGSGEALVWCSEPSAIATILGLSQHQWGMLEREMKHCKELAYDYQRSDYRQWEVMPSPTDLEGMVNLLCSHSSIQKPLSLHCHLMARGSNGLNTGLTKSRYAPFSVRLKCVAAFQDHD